MFLETPCQRFNSELQRDNREFDCDYGLKPCFLLSKDSSEGWVIGEFLWRQEVESVISGPCLKARTPSEKMQPQEQWSEEERVYYQ